ncbi:MAG TPA: DNA polymerase III subunit beta [Pseudonocardiaceae bacterium]|jgi:DNA polymerase-3 subunit beta|nr:DNA polymerase III subunit beta [Pseudonocardiaceae bacterium]
MDLTAATAELARLAVDTARLLPSRVLDPVLAGIRLDATGAGVTMSGTDRDRAVRLAGSAIVHTDGAVLVPGRPLADTLRALDEPEVRLAVEGSRLAVRTSRARFALPILDLESHPGVPEPPAAAGALTGPAAVRAFAAVASASSRDDALPLFTGVRLRATGDTLRLIATDRYRLAIAELAWRPARAGLDILVPAGVLTEVARQAAGAAAIGTDIVVRADADRAAISWPGAVIGSALLATPFPDESRYLSAGADATITVEADELANAVRRVGRYADGRGAVTVELGDGEARVRSTGGDDGEAEEAVKATVDGQLTHSYRVQYLADALRTFPGQRVRMAIQRGLKATTITAAAPDPDGLVLRYVVMPMVQRS